MSELGVDDAVRSDVLARLLCNRCGSAIDENATSIVCIQGHEMSMDRGYIDASPTTMDAPTRATLDSFGYEWTTFDKIHPEDEAFWQRYFRDVPLDALRNAVALDAGCGKGRFSRFTSQHVKSLVALDGSAAVEAAVRNLADLPNVVVVKADLRTPPFTAASFDFVYCLGVLHHLEDPHQGFVAITNLLAPNGLLLLYVYSRTATTSLRRVGLRAATSLRRATVHVPRRMLRVLAAPLAVMLYASVVLPGAIGERFGIKGLVSMPLQTYRHRPLRSLWLDTFDRLSAPREHRYLSGDVEAWLSNEGLITLASREDAGLIVLAQKPGSRESTTRLER